MAKFLLAFAIVLSACGLSAQNTPKPKQKSIEERLAELEKAAETERAERDAEIAALRDELEALRDANDERQYERQRRLRVYGDLAIRWYLLDSNGPRSSVNGEGSQVNRPEYRARVGVTGFVLDEFKHRLKYNIRLSNQGFNEFEGPLGAPATSYRPFEAFGSTTSVQLDRFWIRHAYKNFLFLGLGRWQTPLRTSELLFDNDVGLTGGYASLDVGRLAGAYEQSDIDDWRDFGQATPGFSRLYLTLAGYYLAQDSIGFPEKRADHVPYGFSVQLAGKLR
ncbi:MAG: putative porin, partial [Planctomycetes bacterium]|nr:putative porin [Planctomycetota bacterium]